MNIPNKKIILLPLFAVLLHCANHLQAQETLASLIKKKYVYSLVGENPEKEIYLKLLSKIPRETEMSDQNVIELHQMYPVTEKRIDGYIRTLDTDGSWSDINYKDKKRSGWEVKIHAERILEMTKFYRLKKDTGKTSERLISAIHRSMSYWFKQEFKCSNWWYNRIGIPRTLGPAFLLFEQEMTANEKLEAIKVMQNSTFGMTGQNKVWLAGNVLICALLQNDDDLLTKARNEICSEIVLDRKEGIKPDWSFHQHGPQQQFGNYGLAYLCNMSFYAGLLAGTSLALHEEQQQILVSLLLDGNQWIVWKGYWDVNALNRQLYHNADVHKPLNLLFAACDLKQSCTIQQVMKIEAFIKRNFKNTGINDFCGTKHFHYSDYTIHRTSKWMASLRMASERVIGTELVNEDNLKGYYMADGALYVYNEGNEYHNIFPLWNWRKIPGITTYSNDAPIPNPNKIDARNRTRLVGGTTFEGTGISAMQLNRNNLHANKMWVFRDEYIFCIGGDIQADSTGNSLMTCIDQRLAQHKVWQKDNQRFYHNKIGYIIMEADTCISLIEKRQGQWCDFMGMYSPRTIKGDIFSLCIQHEMREKPASYQYVILPHTTRKHTASFPTTIFQVTQNDDQAQVVIIDKYCYVAVYKSATIALPNGNNFHLNTPGTYILQTNGHILSSRNFD